MTNWKPLDDYILVEVKEKQNASKIKLLDGSNANEANKYLVVADIGPKVTDVHIDDVIMIDAYCQKFAVDNNYFFVKRESIIAVKQ